MTDMNNNGGIMRVKRKTKTYESGGSGATTNTNSANGGVGLLSNVGGSSSRDKRQSLTDPVPMPS